MKILKFVRFSKESRCTIFEQLIIVAQSSHNCRSMNETRLSISFNYNSTTVQRLFNSCTVVVQSTSAIHELFQFSISRCSIRSKSLHNRCNAFINLIQLLFNRCLIVNKSSRNSFTIDTQSKKNYKSLHNHCSIVCESLFCRCTVIV